MLTSAGTRAAMNQDSQVICTPRSAAMLAARVLPAMAVMKAAPTG